MADDQIVARLPAAFNDDGWLATTKTGVLIVASVKANSVRVPLPGVCTSTERRARRGTSGSSSTPSRFGDVDDANRLVAESADRHRLPGVSRQRQLVIVGLVGVPVAQTQRIEQAEVRVTAERFEPHDVRALEQQSVRNRERRRATGPGPRSPRRRRRCR